MQNPARQEISSPLSRLLLPSVFAALTALFLSELHLQRDNTLHGKPHLESTKTGLERPVIGAQAYTRSRNALYRNRLQLGTWGGFQQVVTKHPIELESADFEFGLGEDEYLSFLFRVTESAFAAVRVSHNATFPSQYVEGTGDGEFTHRVIMESPTLAAGRHRMSLRIEGSRANVEIDGESAGSFEIAVPPGGRVGFRGSGGASAWVDDVVIHRADGLPPIREDFRNQRNQWITFCILFAVLMLIIVGVDRLIASRQTDGSTLHIVGFSFLLTLLAWILLAIDHYYLAAIYPTPDEVDYLGADHPFEGADEVIERLLVEHSETKDANTQRILFLGSSQTWGSGAEKLEHVWVERFEERLNEASRDVRYETINLSTPGAVAWKILPLYLKNWNELKPDIVVANFGHNGKDTQKLRNSLGILMHQNRHRGIHTVLVLEPISHEVYDRRGVWPASAGIAARISANHELIQEFGDRHDIPVIDMHESMMVRADTGFLWWDHLRPTSFGHRSMADKLFEQRALVIDRTAGKRPPGEDSMGSAPD
ncbi:SGNH/GDSL hydrolase family protein [Myxococcota bacterium]|nr:SGNH/GDSL hydrolase family protein [Myxococcota bacterium]